MRRRRSRGYLYNCLTFQEINGKTLPPLFPTCTFSSPTGKVPSIRAPRLFYCVILCSRSFSTRASPHTWKPTCSFYVNNNKAEAPAPRLVRILRDLCNNFHALPCRQNVPQYQLQQEGNLASSKTKVCIRVKQLFTLFELLYLTHGTLCAWSSASFTLNLWQRVRWITKSFSLPSTLPPSPVVLFSILCFFTPTSLRHRRRRHRSSPLHSSQIIHRRI